MVAADPYGQYDNVTKLVGRDGYRLRVGDRRVLFELQDEQCLPLTTGIW